MDNAFLIYSTLIIVSPSFLSLFFAHFLALKSERFFYRHSGHEVISTLGAVLVYAILFFFFALFFGEIVVNFLETSGDSGIGQSVWLTMVVVPYELLTILALSWILGILLLIRDIRIVRITIGTVPKTTGWKYAVLLFVVCLLVVPAVLFTWGFIII